MSRAKEDALEKLKSLPKAEWPGLNPYRPLLKAKIEPSFHPSHWFCLVRDDNDHLQLYCALKPFPFPEQLPKHNCHYDKKKGLIHWQVPAEENILENIEALLTKTQLHLRPEQVAGLDGTSYELELPRIGWGLKTRWWLKPPEGLEPLDDIIQLLATLGDIEQ